jgi:RimJ/RimL family protein N-acetyltransferase
MDPILIDVPEELDAGAWRLRSPRAGDGAALLAMQAETMAELRPWMPWAQAEPAAADCEAWCRRAHARFLLREDFVWWVFERGGDLPLASVGLHRFDWTLRRFEIGYWRRAGQGGRGIVTEAVRTLTRLCFDRLGATRVEIHMDDANVASWRVAERAGFTLEALLRGDRLNAAGQPASTRVYARVSGVEEPPQAPGKA